MAVWYGVEDNMCSIQGVGLCYNILGFSFNVVGLETSPSLQWGASNSLFGSAVQSGRDLVIYLSLPTVTGHGLRRGEKSAMFSTNHPTYG